MIENGRDSLEGDSEMGEVERFLNAQDANDEFEAALSEIRSGRKQSHWIWYVFPQLSGLGASRMSRIYGIRNRDEAVEYLRHRTLYPRLQAITSAVFEHVSKGARLDQVMGSAIDAQKLVSCMTLFGAVAKSLDAKGESGFGTFAAQSEGILAAGEAQGYPRCRFTLEQLGG